MIVPWYFEQSYPHRSMDFTNQGTNAVCEKHFIELKHRCKGTEPMPVAYQSFDYMNQSDDRAFLRSQNSTDYKVKFSANLLTFWADAL